MCSGHTFDFAFGLLLAVLGESYGMSVIEPGLGCGRQVNDLPAVLSLWSPLVIFGQLEKVNVRVLLRSYGALDYLCHHNHV